ncbi:uncharacterized protein LOC112589228 [Harpegnathos saltator]|uniref:uncharacterized protein LOC112589228 n=1 Tax=Harpegnathos saltator TaxID=610380 RepID=UPI000DBEDC5B|nr:uncharacterized protein LOC112589228 [Harpegnathos saltator]XP_025157426.1 uncharacterized protein LOC112589228 [Harpegnathos saltator]
MRSELSFLSELELKASLTISFYLTSFYYLHIYPSFFEQNCKWKMNSATVEEKIEMILIYGECRRNVDDAVALYAERFPDNVRSRSFLYKVVTAFISYGSVQTKKRKRRTTVTGEVNEIAVLAAVHHNPQMSLHSQTMVALIGITCITGV